MHQCPCGKRFYNSNGSWTWEEGELEELQEDNDAIDLEWPVGYVEFEGVQYVVDCDCWKKRAEQVMNFLDGHRQQIIDYFKLEKERILKEANDIPDV